MGNRSIFYPYSSVSDTLTVASADTHSKSPSTASKGLTILTPFQLVSASSSFRSAISDSALFAYPISVDRP